MRNGVDGAGVRDHGEVRLGRRFSVEYNERILAELDAGVPGMISFDLGDFRSQCAPGQGVLGFDWGDTGIIGSTAEESTIRGQMGTAILPGAMEVYHPVIGKWLTL